MCLIYRFYASLLFSGYLKNKCNPKFNKEMHFQPIAWKKRLFHYSEHCNHISYKVLKSTQDFVEKIEVSIVKHQIMANL